MKKGDFEPIFEVKDKKLISNKVFQKYNSKLKTFVEIAKAHNLGNFNDQS